MTGDRAGARLLRLVAPPAAVALYALWIRPRMLTWGATPEEATRTYPGDEFIPNPNGGVTMAAIPVISAASCVEGPSPSPRVALGIAGQVPL